VYTNPWKWRLLCAANKEALEHSNNPVLIEVGMRLLIPGVGNEKREGDYDPLVKYPPPPLKQRRTCSPL
jgi:hypothetical protein